MWPQIIMGLMQAAKGNQAQNNAKKLNEPVNLENNTPSWQQKAPSGWASMMGQGGA